MKIEVAVNQSASPKERGDLLEELTARLLKAQSYEVIKEIRFTAVELDLLCRHKISGKEIYVECKAYRDKNIDSNILKNLAGTLLFKNYDEAWLVGTGGYGKEALGFVKEWQQKPKSEATRLSFYDPEKVIESLISAGVIREHPKDKAAEHMGSENLIGEWVLLVTKFGMFWAAATLSGGIPVGVICYYANNNELLTDSKLQDKLSETDTSLNSLDFSVAKIGATKPKELSLAKIVDVVQVQTGEAWTDYRPARPEDFVGRTKDINFVFDFFKNIKEKKTNTRIFAITGNSGMGKSSFIAKLRNKASNYHNKNKFFVFPVDVRAATGPEYIYSSLLNALKEAQSKGFGDLNIDLVLSDVGNPLNSETIKTYLESLEEKKQIITLVFDQFEELYSKPEMFEVFEKAKSLLLNAASMKLNFCLGFAWKTDSTTHSEHPAYFFWHELSDYRITRKLSPFSDGESGAAISIFEKEINQKLHTDLRHNLIVSSQGYPWLLKKLCIHLYEKIESGSEQDDLLENKLDISSLFKGDMDELDPGEAACLKLIAQRAPVDWFEVIETSGPDILKSLINRRLVIRSGDRLNIYWDIFREYILTGNVPVIPLRYLPSNDFSSLYKIVGCLDHKTKVSVQELVQKVNLSEGTVKNIGSDMIMFGVANRESGLYSLSSDIIDGNEASILKAIREKFKKHAFTHAFKEKAAHNLVTLNVLVDTLKKLFPDNKYAEKTWYSYTIRLCRWLELCGFIEVSGNGWIYRDRGDVVTGRQRTERRRRKSKIFTAPSSPALVLETLNWLKEKGKVSKEEDMPKGYQNALAVLRRFELIYSENNNFSLALNRLNKFSNYSEAIWVSANLENILLEVVKLIEDNNDISGKEIGSAIAAKYELSWSDASILRYGGPIKLWAHWLYEGKKTSVIPKCPGRT